MQAVQETLFQDAPLENDTTNPTALALGEVRWVGNWQTRNFKGFYQSREGGVGDWKFHISSFDHTTTGEPGKCTLLMVGGGYERVSIDARDRIEVLGVKYGRKNWCH